MQGNRKWGRRVLLAAAALGFAWAAAPGDAQAGMAANAASAVGALAQQDAKAGLVEPVIFWHRRQQQELYCVEGRYWWYYRPYQGSDDYARCMPYFKYPERPAGQYPPQGGLK